MRILLGLYGAIFLVPLVYNPFGLKPYELAKQNWFLALLCFFILGCVVVLWRKKRLSVAWNPWLITFGFLWMISYVVSTIWSVAPTESIWGTYDRLNGLFIQIFYAAHFIIAFYIFEKIIYQKYFLRILIVIGVLLSTHAILQRFGIDPILRAADYFPGRSFSLMGSPNGLGQFLIFPLIACAILLKEHWHARYAIALVFLAGGLLSTYNRASILAVLIGFTLYLAHEKLKSKRTIVIICMGGLILALIAGYVFMNDNRSLGTRTVLWSESVKLIPEHPLIGSGPATFYQQFQKVSSPDLYLYERMTDIPESVHNEFLSIILERGIFGGILYLTAFGFLAWIFFTGRLKTTFGKIAFAGVAAYSIAVQFGFSGTTHLAIALVFWAHLARSSLSLQTKEINLHWPLKTALTIFLITISLAGLVHAGRVTFADIHLKRAVTSYMHGDDLATLEHFSKMSFLNPYHAYPYRTAFFFYKKDCATRPCEKWVEQVGKITNKNFQYHLDRAELSMRNGDIENGQAFFEEARVLAPSWAILWETWGDIWFERQDFEMAIPAYEKLLTLAPPYWQWNTNLGEKSFEDREKYRIFRLTHGRFYETLEKLRQSYIATGREVEAEEIVKHL